MYVASLNLDLMFKKVFSDPEIAKSFLQDLLGIIITEITILSIETKLTNDAVIVKFDYRCKINGQYVIIEMQQRYKKDVVKRFYLYHCVGTSLQLEILQSVTVTRANGETYKEKDYGSIEPVITVIWMGDDTLGFDEDFIVFTTLPEATKDFITDDTLWAQPIETILKARAKTLKILNNKTKGLDFLQENKMIYLFQDNIAKNAEIKPYSKWCIFGKKSKNPNNVESDFEEFKNDKVMAEVIRRLETTKLEPFEFDYAYHTALHEHFWEEDRKEMALEKKEMALETERAKKHAAEAEKHAAERAERAERAEKEKNDMLSNAVHGFLALGKDIPYIAGILGLSIEETNVLAQTPRR